MHQEFPLLSLPFSSLTMSLPMNLKPGNDLMAKRILRDPKVMEFITESLTGTQDDYFIGNCEWSDGTRSYMALGPKPSVDFPPIIVKIQHTINVAFMKRVVNYCLHAYNRYDSEPVILIVCVEKLHQEVYKNVKQSSLPGVFSYFSELWAKHCYIISEESIKDNLSISPNPLAALGSFFTNHSLSLTNHPFKNDPTIQYLYVLTIFEHHIDTINKKYARPKINLIDLEKN